MPALENQTVRLAATPAFGSHGVHPLVARFNRSTPAARPVAQPKRKAPAALRRPAAGGGGTVAPRPAFAAVKRRLSALGTPWLTGSQAASVFNCGVAELMQIAKFSLTPDLCDVGVVKRFSSEELLAWAAGGFQFGQRGDTPLAQRQGRFIERVARDETRTPSKKHTARVAASHAARNAAFSR